MTDKERARLHERIQGLRRQLLEWHDDDARITQLAGELAAVADELAVEGSEDRAGEPRDSLAHRLERERRRHFQFFEAAPDPYVVTDARGVVTDANRRAREVLEVRRSSPLVLSVARSSRVAFYRLVSSEAPSRQATLEFQTLTGPSIMDTHCDQLDANELLWLLRDVTELEQARRLAVDLARTEGEVADRLRSVDDARRSFVIAVSHDLRTPLAAIAGLADLLADAPAMPAAERDRGIGLIRDSARRVIALFTDLLDLNRLEEGAMVVDRAHIDVGEVVARTARRVDVGARSLHLDCRAHAAVDSTLVERIVENLVRNAAIHTPEGTNIWVACRQDPDGTVITVEDDGPGVPEELAPTIFELFHRARTPGSTEGLGVGLAIVRRFAELHGGYARLHRRSGGGAVFQVVLAGS